MHMPSMTLLYNKTLAEMAGNDVAWSILKTASRISLNTDIPYDAFNFVRDKGRGLWLFGSRVFGNVYRYRFDSGDDKGISQECILYSPLLNIESSSIDEINIQNIPGFGKLNNEFGKITTAFISMTYDGVTYGKEWAVDIGEINNHNLRILARRLGYVREFFGFKVRINSQKRLAFSGATLEVS